MVYTSWLRHVCFIFVYILLVDCLNSSQPEAVCPYGCKCYSENVNCLHSNLSSIPTGLPLGNLLHKLIFARNKITQVGLELQEYTELRFLDFTNNNISEIQDGAFKRLSFLETLLLSRNFIAKTEQFTFSNLASLQYLDLSYNTLRCVKTDNFKDLRQLVTLNLARNKLALVEPHGFRGLTNLQVLKLNRNYLDLFPVKIFQVLTSLKMLILDDNQIRYLPDAAFSMLGKLEYLSLTGNRLQTIAPTCFVTSSGASIPLKKLFLIGTDLDTLPQGTLKSLKRLEILDLSQTRISSLSENMFDGLTSLQHFIMSSSEFLTSIESDTFLGMTSLKRILIDGNTLLSDMRNVSLSSLKHLETVDFSDNSIVTLPRDLLDWSRDIILDIRGNNFVCDCRISWIESVLSEIKNNETISNLKQLSCSSPDELKGRQIVSLSSNDFRCSTVKTKLHQDYENRAKIGAIAATTGFLFLITLALLVKFRKQLCIILRKQYRYSSYVNKNGVFKINADNECTDSEEATPMEEFSRVPVC